MKRKVKGRRVQRGVQRAARSRVAKSRTAGPGQGADPGPVATAEAEAPARPMAGLSTRFQPGNRASVQHLVYSERLPPGLEDLPAQLDQFMSAQLLDEGDDADRLSARRRSLLSHRVFTVERNIRKLAHTLDQKGLVDSKGKLRVQWLQMLSTFIDKAIRLDTLLGLERRPRRVESPIEWLQRRAAEKAAIDADAPDIPSTSEEEEHDHER
jgi:hypothetical protein